MLMKIEFKCSWEGCRESATHMACGRDNYPSIGHSKPAYYCESHADLVADERAPEYNVSCPNCGCKFGVN